MHAANWFSNMVGDVMRISESSLVLASFNDSAWAQAQMYTWLMLCCVMLIRSGCSRDESPLGVWD